jgi:hypothetical protein
MGFLLSYTGVRCNGNVAFGFPNTPKLPVLSDELVEKARVYDPKTETLEDFLNIRFGPEMPTINDDKSPQRDVVNFPRVKPLTYPETTRLYIIPDVWFRYFYKKTGVTGPYVFGIGFTTFLFSKELFVIEHEFINGLALFIIIYMGVRLYGPQMKNLICSKVDVSIYC